MKKWAALAGATVFDLYQVAANGLLLSLLWGWLIVPHFAVPEAWANVSWAQGAAVAMFACVLGHKPVPPDENPRELARRLVILAIRPWLELGLGWLVSVVLL